MTAAIELDALVSDRYLDALLASAERHADDAPADPALAPDVRDAARTVRRALVRVHPSFRFEERLASRLADLAAVHGSTALAAAGGSGAVLPFPARSPLSARSGDGGGASLEGADPLLDAILRGELDPADADAIDRAAHGAPDRRPLIVGGAITSAAISLVGVAFVAWRASRPAARSSGRAMGRAARAARARRTAAALAEGIGSLGGPA